MSDTTSLRAQVAGIFEAMNLAVPADDFDLFESGVLDSMAFVQLVLALEGTLGVRVAFDDLEVDNFRTINHIVSFVVNHRRHRRVAS